MEAPEGKERQKGAERLFEETVAENSLNITEDKSKFRTRWLCWWITKTFIPPRVPFRGFQKTEEEGTLSYSFYEASIILISMLDKDINKKGNCKPKFLMNIDAKNPQENKPIQQHIKIIHYDRVGFTLGMQ